MHVTLSRIAIAAIIALLFITPILSYAQSSHDEMRGAIRAALLQDPRSSNLSEAELSVLVEELATQAEGQGISAHDITWRPGDPETFNASPGSSASSCGNMPAFICALNEAYGFSGSSPMIALLLGIASGLLIFLIGMALHHLGHHPLRSFTPVK